MDKQTKKLLSAAYLLKEHCKDSFCPSCIFYRSGTNPVHCRLVAIPPAKFDVHEDDTED